MPPTADEPDMAAYPVRSISRSFGSRGKWARTATALQPSISRTKIFSQIKNTCRRVAHGTTRPNRRWPGSEKPGNTHSAGDLGHLFRKLDMNLFERFVDRGNDQILEHLHIVGVHCFFFY